MNSAVFLISQGLNYMSVSCAQVGGLLEVMCLFRDGIGVDGGVGGCVAKCCFEALQLHS